MSHRFETYGIDLGTTYSCLAVIGDDGCSEVVYNPNGNRTTPSVIALDENGKWIVGEAAKAMFSSNPDNVVAFIKSDMDNYLHFKYRLQGREFSSVDISAQILKYLVGFANKKRMEEEGKPPITDVVMTYPGYFGSCGHSTILHASRMAGLNMLRGINEPTAAALSYSRSQKDDKILMVYDLGGCTFDVSIMTFEAGMANILSTCGDHHLGGVDWDRAIVDCALEQIGAKWEDLDKATQGMLMNAAEKTKKIISDPDEEESVLSFNYNGVRKVAIRRDAFEARTVSLIWRTKLYVQEALDAAGMRPFDVDEVILVGGSSRMPMVPRMINDMFPDSEVNDVEPDLAVAKGVAYLGSLEWFL